MADVQRGFPPLDSPRLQVRCCFQVRNPSQEHLPDSFFVNVKNEEGLVGALSPVKNETEKRSKLVFYAQSTGTAISGRKKRKKKKEERGGGGRERRRREKKKRKKEEKKERKKKGKKGRQRKEK